MLKTIDQALAGAIDIIADDVQATVKSVREQGVMRTLGDAVEDAAGLVKTGASTVMQGVVGSKKGPEKISNHAGVSSSYADLCAGPGSRSVASGGAVFPFVPSSGPPKAKAPNLAPARTTSGLPVFAKHAAGGQAALGTIPQRSFPSAPMPSVSSTCAAGSPPASAGAKDPPLPTGVLAGRFEEIKKREVANEKCFDCGAVNPEWASVSFGVFLCIECAGHHREMGTHISRIRSCKMDSWTERQLQIFSHSGNKHVAEFFAANRVSSTARYQRYQTPAAEWFREAWIKNRIFDRPVPAPPQGVVAGPCVDARAEATAAPPTQRGKAGAAAPLEDLLDLDGSTTTAVATKAAAHVDLLGFDDAATTVAASTSASVAADVDLLGTLSSAPNVAPVSAGGDLLGLDGGTMAKAASGGAEATPLDFVHLMQHPAAAPQNVVAPAAVSHSMVAPLPKAEAPKEEKASDPFAMALEKWGM